MEVKPPREHRRPDAGKLSPGQGHKAGGSITQPWLVVPMARASEERPLVEAAWDEHGPLASSGSLGPVPLGGPQSAVKAQRLSGL